MKCSRRSAMVVPGITPTPPVITRVGMPSVCESTAWKTWRVRMGLPPGQWWPAATAFSVAARTSAAIPAGSGTRGGRVGPP